MNDDRFDTTEAKRYIRVVMLLDAADRVGMSPVRVRHLHALAYLSNVLAPVWKLDPLEGRVLKKSGGPFYPEFQRALDHLVGTGVTIISQVSHVFEEGAGWRLEGRYQLNPTFSRRIVAEIDAYSYERQVAVFVRELVYAASTLTDQEMTDAVSQDATYLDPIVSFDSVIDFAEWQQRNFSTNAANYFARFTSAGSFTTPGEKLHLYVSHIKGRLEHSLSAL
jgi:hypothetical protein